MKRRDFIKKGALTASAVGVASTIQGAPIPFKNRSKTKSSRPNILFVMTDQQCAEAIRAFGNKDLHTPSMDRIAKYAMNFKKAYCPTPLCVPSRSSMFTGLYPHEINVPINNLKAEWNTTEYPYMGNILKTAGYDTGYVGKWHLPASPKDKHIHGFDFIKHARANDLDPDVAEASIEFLSQERDKPFLLVSSFVNPHDICQWARGEAMRNDAIGVPPKGDQCPELPDNFEIPELEPDVIRYVHSLSKRTYPTDDWSESKWRQYRWAYYRLVEKVDAHLKPILDALEEKDLLEDTVIIFTSDHGDGNAHHKWNQKQILYDEAARVPFMISWKGHTEITEYNDLPISTGIDLIPTMCEIAGVKAPVYMKGKPLFKLSNGDRTAFDREYTITETEFCLSKVTYGVKGRMVRSSRYKYIVYEQGHLKEQFFDMDSDPGEMTNLAYDKNYKELKNKHIDVLKEWIKETRDNFQI
ncbi:sulfatase-like hydrolase/transferase [Halosquirtibacter laminarini]|uniref:Sulfatase-like hydrolase/transferase n=1 Tax=Halosquirtibacter laminarini TaxID=3374600 RepID=A0AC61NL75_9BACT|nr:sulfatase-like hydrolase/transferase [Prolixibacteraceae bacterium]